jgi:hypothetical protein
VVGDLEAVGFHKWVLVRVDDAMLKHNPTPPVKSQPINLETDLATDEHGNSLHGDCYTKEINPEASGQRVPSNDKSAA